MSEAWRTIRVFISSTFKDMHAERDHLVRFVFPRLREELLGRRMHMVDVDLRWGVTGEQDAFDLCMDEIDRCHPRFICMLGGRYGWVPPPKVVRSQAFERALAGELTSDERAVLSEMYARAADVYRLREKPRATDEAEEWAQMGERAVGVLRRAGVTEAQLSITASEIFYAALNRLDEPAFRYFYFRDPALTKSIPAPHAGLYREPEDSAAEAALENLKEQIRGSEGPVKVAPDRIIKARLPVFEYPCAWDAERARITRLEQFGEQVYRDLMASIDAEFGPKAAEALSEFDEERAAMESFVETRVERYVTGSRRGVFDRLREHAEGSGGNGYLCVVGEPGSGKSALLGKFYQDFVGDEARSATPGDQIVIAHFVGASAASTNARQVLRRFCHELSAGAGLTEEIPDEYDKLREAFQAILKKASEVRHVLILIDAINQMDEAHSSHAMRWLPDELPENARLIMSVMDDPGEPAPALEALRARRRPPAEIVLPRLQQADAAAIVEEFLSRYRKSFDEEQRAALLSKRDAGTPLYLLTALEELRTLGTYEEITGRIRQLPEETRPLFHWILERLEADDGFRDERGSRSGPELVKRYCSYLALGRAGMAQSELSEIISPADEERALPADHLGNVAALQRLLRPYLMRRGELLDFFHGQLREAVKEKYLRDTSAMIDGHKQVADYFRGKADPEGNSTWTGRDVRALSELPYHQTGAQLWDEVHETLTDLAFLEAKCTHVAVSITGKGDEARQIYGGVYELQEDYRHTLEKFPE